MLLPKCGLNMAIEYDEYEFLQIEEIEKKVCLRLIGILYLIENNHCLMIRKSNVWYDVKNQTKDKVEIAHFGNISNNIEFLIYERQN
jgi:hypothetical protein